jgi:hypothetical protein
MLQKPTAIVEEVFSCYLSHLFVLQIKEEKYFIHNHLSFRVMYHKDPETDSARIVGFEVTPKRCGTLFLSFVSSFFCQCSMSVSLC